MCETGRHKPYNVFASYEKLLKTNHYHLTTKEPCRLFGLDSSTQRLNFEQNKSSNVFTMRHQASVWAGPVNRKYHS